MTMVAAMPVKAEERKWARSKPGVAWLIYVDTARARTKARARSGSPSMKPPPGTAKTA